MATLKSRLAAADKDGYGKLTHEECQAGMPRIYKGFDRTDRVLEALEEIRHREAPTARS